MALQLGHLKIIYVSTISRSFTTNEVPGRMTQALQYNVKTGSYHHPKPQANYTVSSNYSGFSGVSSGDSLPGPGPQLHER